jgi:hypothetical protein
MQGKGFACLDVSPECRIQPIRECRSRSSCHTKPTPDAEGLLMVVTPLYAAQFVNPAGPYPRPIEGGA